MTADSRKYEEFVADIYATIAGLSGLDACAVHHDVKVVGLSREAGGLPLGFDQATWEVFTAPLLAQGLPAVHHSETYRAAYAPAYRVVLVELRRVRGRVSRSHSSGEAGGGGISGSRTRGRKGARRRWLWSMSTKITVSAWAPEDLRPPRGPNRSKAHDLPLPHSA